MEKSDLDALLAGMSAEQVDQVHRILHQWNLGPSTSFPVQMSLLTKAQWHAAASIPRSMNDSRKLIEQHLAQYRLETTALVKNLSSIASDQADKLKAIVAAHAKTVDEASVSARNQLWETEEIAKRIRKSLEDGILQWDQAKSALADERLRFQKVCDELDDRLAWRNLLWWVLGADVFFIIGMAAEHYRWIH